MVGGQPNKNQHHVNPDISHPCHSRAGGNDGRFYITLSVTQHEHHEHIHFGGMKAMAEIPIHFRTIIELAKDIREKNISPVEVVKSFIDRIDSMDGILNAYRCTCPEQALARARAAEIDIYKGYDLGPLHGIPYAVKDLFDVKGLPTTAGSSLLKDNIAPNDAVSVKALFRSGMILLGKTNTVQFAYSGIGINTDHGTPHNPWSEIPHTPGGSSSGSAVSVAAGLTPMAMGSDTGGSIRIPSALCGVTGLKPTVGRVSKTGVYPLSMSMDSVGPLVRSAEDAAWIYQNIQGSDIEDETTLGLPATNVLSSLNEGVKGLRLAFAESIFWDNIHPDIEKAVRGCGDVFKALGADVEHTDFTIAADAQKLNSNGLVISAEAYMANKDWLENHFDQMDPLVANRMIKGKQISAEGYLNSTLEWKRLRAQAIQSLNTVDALLVPTTCIPAIPIDSLISDNSIYTEKNILLLRNTAIGNILNLCGLSVPCGFTKEGLPIGLMIYAKPFREDLVLRIGHAFQKMTDWHRATPDLRWL